MAYQTQIANECGFAVLRDLYAGDRSAAVAGGRGRAVVAGEVVAAGGAHEVATSRGVSHHRQQLGGIYLAL